MSNVINWFEIPVVDLIRAKDFYETVMDCQLNPGPPGMPNLAMFPYDGEVTGGALTQSAEFEPSKDGAVLFLNAGADLAKPLSRVETAGGTILTPKTRINDEVGYYATFLDTEGNRIGLHSRG